MKYMKQVTVALILLMLLFAISGCSNQKRNNGNQIGTQNSDIPNMVIDSVSQAEEDQKGSFETEAFLGSKSKAVVLGGSRTEKITQLEEAEIQREEVPDGTIEWIPGIW